MSQDFEELLASFNAAGVRYLIAGTRALAPIRIDIISTLGTLSFRKAWEQRVEAPFGNVPAFYLSREHLIADFFFVCRRIEIKQRFDVSAHRGTP